MVLPLVFVFVIAHFPAGLVLYWVTTNLWTVGQGLITRRLVPKTPRAVEPLSRTPPKPPDGGGNGAKATQPPPDRRSRRRPPPQQRAGEAARRRARAGDRRVTGDS